MSLGKSTADTFWETRVERKKLASGVQNFLLMSESVQPIKLPNLSFRLRCVKATVWAFHGDSAGF